MLDSDERRLTDLTDQLFVEYGKLNEILDGMGDGSVATIEPMAEQMSSIRKIEEELQPLRKQFVESERAVTSSLKEKNDLTVELIKTVMPKLDELQIKTTEAAKRLYPQVQECVRAVQMQDAYSARSKNIA